MEIGIVAQKGNERALDLVAEIKSVLEPEAVDIRIDEATAGALDVPGIPARELATCPLVVSVGGDGTFLYASRHVGSTPILGINLGEVGFLNAVPPAEATERVREEIRHVRNHGEPRYREVPRIEARSRGLSLSPGLNEIVLQGPQRGRGQGIDLAIEVDGSEYVSTHADGVLVATPTGSTAYNLSEGGPLMHPDASGFLLTTMCPETAAPPLVVGTDATIEIDVDGASEAVVASDGSERGWIDVPASVDVARAAEPARIAGPRPDFFRALEKIE